jgi:hypothetical protein
MRVVGWAQANWAGVILNSIVNFIVPPLIYIVAIRRTQREAAAHHHHHTATTGAGATSNPASASATATASDAAALQVHVNDDKAQPLLAPAARSRSASTSSSSSSSARAAAARAAALTTGATDPEAAALAWSVVPPRLWPYRIRFAQVLVGFMFVLCAAVVIVNIVQAAGVNV